jgi:DNA repair exonuclease SbcCD nuclease subunit
MRILWFTDIHLRPEYKSRGEKFLNFICELAEQEKPDLIVNTGDTFHTKDKVFTSMTKMYEIALARMLKVAPVVNIVGNHDWGVLYATHALEYYDSIEIGTNKVVNVSDTYRIGNIGFTAYVKDDVKMKKSLSELRGCEYLFGHFDINGFQLGSGWEEVSAVASTDTFKNFSYVLSGHYHLAQEKQIGDTKFIYCGSPYTIDFGESDQSKRVMIIDTEKKEFRSINTNMTYHKTLTIKAGEDFPVIPDEEIENGVEYRYKLVGTKEEIKDLEKAKPKEIKAKIVHDQRDSGVVRSEISMANGTDSAISEYTLRQVLRSYKIDASSDLKAASKKLGMDIEALVSMGQKYAANARSGIK